MSVLQVDKCNNLIEMKLSGQQLPGMAVAPSAMATIGGDEMRVLIPNDMVGK
jgi:hypothetical protein